MNNEFTNEEIEQGRWLFSGDCNFVAGATEVSRIPPNDLPEVAFCGLSNVGKSTIINALTGRKTLARTSNTPGHTRQVNFFNLRESLTLVDLPGYGYAKAPKQDILGWTKLIFSYLKGRPNLKRVCLLVDARRSIKESDEKIMTLLDDMAVSYQIVLTKVDKIKKSDIDDVVSNIRQMAFKHTALHPEIIATSSRDNVGIEFLKAELAKLI